MTTRFARRLRHGLVALAALGLALPAVAGGLLPFPSTPGRGFGRRNPVPEGCFGPTSAAAGAPGRRAAAVVGGAVADALFGVAVDGLVPAPAAGSSLGGRALRNIFRSSAWGAYLGLSDALYEEMGLAPPLVVARPGFFAVRPTMTGLSDFSPVRPPGFDLFSPDPLLQPLHLRYQPSFRRGLDALGETAIGSQDADRGW